MNVNVVFIPLARKTFSMPDAESIFQKSCAMLENVMGNFSKPDELLTSPEMLSDYIDTIKEPDLIIYQSTTFIGSDFITEITRRFRCSIVIWSVKEPSIDGGRLKLNSLTGAFSAGNSLYTQSRKFQFVMGNPDEAYVICTFQKIFNSLQLIKKLRKMVIGMVGSQPPGFGFGSIGESQLAGKFGIKVVQTEASEIMRDAETFKQEDLLPWMDELKGRSQGWEKFSDEHLEKYARLRKSYQEFIDRTGVTVVASKCWPDFFTGFGAPVCSILSMLNDNGIPASCEADMGGVISMFIGSELTGEPTYLGDPVAVDENCDGIVFWHCGAGATRLARKQEGANLGVHPNRKIGPTMEFGLKEGEITLLRLGVDTKGFRMFAMKATALNEPQKFFGTSITVRPQGGKSIEKVSQFVKDGWEPHFVIAYGNILEELEIICSYLDIPINVY